MIHNRKDYEDIQDPSGKIPENEPVFLLRAQDKVAPAIVMTWAHLAKKAGANQVIIDHAINHANLMRKWQAEHGSKVPDIPTEEVQP